MGITIPELEAWFDEHGLVWELVDVPVDQIDQLTGLTNQARLEPLDEETVERYAADMADGAVFPPIVLTAEGLSPVGGNHRLAAARRSGREQLAAYVVSGLDAHHEWLLALEDNRRHGLPLSTAERAHHAARLVNDGETITAAARICGIPAHAVTRHLDKVRADQRAVATGVHGPDWESLSTTTKQRLGGINHDRVFAKAAQLCVSGAITATDVGATVGRLNAADTPADAMQLLVALEEAALVQTSRPQGRPPSMARAPRAKLLADLAGILRFDPDHVAADVATPDLRVLNQIHSTVAHLTRISTVIANAQDGAA